MPKPTPDFESDPKGFVDTARAEQRDRVVILRDENDRMRDPLECIIAVLVQASHKRLLRNAKTSRTSRHLPR